MGDDKRDITGYELYLTERKYLVGGREQCSLTTTKMPSGMHTFDFHCDLPAALPTSCESSIGHVRYTVQVTIDRLLRGNKEFLQPFTVIKPLDLNNDEAWRAPMAEEVTKTFHPLLCCCLSSTATLRLIARTAATGYVPGQQIDLDITADNRSGHTAMIRAQLERVVLSIIDRMNSKTF